LLSIRDKLLYGVNEKINSYTITGLWKRALSYAKNYQEFDEEISFIDDELDCESSEDSN
ncbi:19094_t:CDS:1, partial [Racocetra persica]